MKPVEFLNEIVALFQDGEREDALELIDAYLIEHTDDSHARLLKAEMCLELDARPDYVGQALLELEPRIGHTRHFKQLQRRVEDMISRKMSEGRDLLRRESGQAALACFEMACELAPYDPAVPLAAALAWIDQPAESESELAAGLLSQRSQSDFEIGTPPGDAGTDDVLPVPERFLHLALRRSTSGEGTHAQAEGMLVDCWLERGQFVRVAEWLEKTTLPSDAVVNRREKLIQRLTAHIDGTVRALLRAGEIERAEAVIAAWEQQQPPGPRAHLWRAEALRLREQQSDALAAYESALRLAEMTDNPPEIPYHTTFEIWRQTQAVQITCRNCGRANSAWQSKCLLCETALRQYELVTDRHYLENVVPLIVAHVGLAELLPETYPQTRIEHLYAALDALPEWADRAQRSLKALVNEWAVEERPSEPDTVIPDLVRQHRLTVQTIDQLRQITPSAWETIPLQTRLAVVRRLLTAGMLLEAQELSRTIFADNPALPSVRKVLAQLEDAFAVRFADVLHEARSMLKQGQAERAARLASDALLLCPHDPGARLLRANARFQAGNYPDALGDLQRVSSDARDQATIQVARLNAVKVMERLGQITSALETLDGVQGQEAKSLRERLVRRRRNEPFIQVEQAHDLVMHDTLTHTKRLPHYRGYFAVAVRAVRRPWKASGDAWRDGVLSAGYTFIQVLGGLRNVPGDPIFALRFISRPNPYIPERGHLTLALLVRVTGDDEPTCQDTARDLWWALRDILPGVQAHVYGFEPVVDQDELARLRRPFAVENAAEIVRHEEVPTRDGERYAVYPFTVGELDLHNLCWTLLRQDKPAMVSIHLLPTSMMPWEQSALHRMMLDEAGQKQDTVAEPARARLHDPVAHWWQYAPDMGRAQSNRHLLDNLRASAYILAVNVAGSGGARLLPERVAAALFGALRSANGGLFGGYEIARATCDRELQVARNNLAGVDVERWAFTAAAESAPRLRHLVSEYEAALAFRLPVPGYEGLPGVPFLDIRPIAPPAGLPENGVCLGESVVRVNGAALPITQAIDDRRRHTYIVGRTGTGKSNLIKNLALQDMEAGHGVCVVDPHGDLIDDLLVHIPAQRADDVILFDPADEARPIGLNLLEHRSEAEKHLIVNEFLAMLMRMYDPGQTGIVGPRFQHNVRNAMLTAMSVEGSTLIEVVRVLSDRRYVQKLLPSVKDPLVRSYWNDQIANTADFHKSEILDYIVSKFNPFVGDRRVRHIIGQRKTTIDFRRVMDERKILLVNLCKGKIGAENAQFLGLLLVQRLLMTALSRADRPPDGRPDFMLYVDEFQTFATKTFATILSEGRKYGVAATVANQYVTQLDTAIRDAIFGNVGTIISFRLGTQDAVALAPEMYPVFSGDDLINLPKYTACVKLLLDGLAARPFTMQTLLDMRLPDHRQAAAIREASRQTYGRDAGSIEEDIATRYAG